MFKSVSKQLLGVGNTNNASVTDTPPQSAPSDAHLKDAVTTMQDLLKPMSGYYFLVLCLHSINLSLAVLNSIPQETNVVEAWEWDPLQFQFSYIIM